MLVPTILYGSPKFLAQSLQRSGNFENGSLTQYRTCENHENGVEMGRGEELWAHTLGK